MNPRRRARVAAVRGRLEKAKQDVAGIHHDEQAASAAQPRTVRGGMYSGTSNAALMALDDACSSIDGAISALRIAEE